MVQRNSTSCGVSKFYHEASVMQVRHAQYTVNLPVVSCYRRFKDKNKPFFTESCNKSTFYILAVSIFFPILFSNKFF